MNKNLLYLSVTALLITGVAGCSTTGSVKKDKPQQINYLYEQADVSFDWTEDSGFEDLGIREQAEVMFYQYLANQYPFSMTYRLENYDIHKLRIESLSSAELDRVLFQVTGSSVRLVGVKAKQTMTDAYGKALCLLEVSISGREVHYRRDGYVAYDGFVVFSNENNTKSNVIKTTPEESTDFAVGIFEIPITDITNRCGFGLGDVRKAVSEMVVR